MHRRQQRGQPPAPGASKQQQRPALGDAHIGARDADGRRLERLKPRRAIGTSHLAIELRHR
jgi:hypothetical protein